MSILLTVQAITAVASGLSAHMQTYPEHSRRLEEEGVVRLVFKVSEKGRVISCRVEISSGFPRLDSAACDQLQSVLKKTGKVDAARDGFERFIDINWALEPPDPRAAARSARLFPERLDKSRNVHIAPAGLLSSGQRVNIGLHLNIDSSGIVESCSVRWGSGSKELDDQACIAAREWRYKPVYKKGVAVRSFTLENFFWAAPDARIAHIIKD
ncbi:TonB family protein [Sphingomonas sp.]|jgi:TonB family protein|uniref:TonB family protein n=1 Tax=Sphingomonas sp. TaxID=28214 RepID=UPI002E0F082D|nr:TonB family protein [Sphingomonas sp.]